MINLTKRAYPLLTRKLVDDEVFFLNFGYEEDPPMAIPLAMSDEPNRFFIQLYHRTATQTDLRGKQILEIGCGHGGGASYITRTLRPRSYIGLDLNPDGIDFCGRSHNVSGLDFVQGDAQSVPFPDQSFDAVINVESSHCYASFPRFLAEVVRVLRPGGHFLHADIRPAFHIAEWEAQLTAAPMRQLSGEVINAQVVRGVEKTAQARRDVIERHLPTFLRRLGRIGVSVADGIVKFPLYNLLKSGDASYRVYHFVKD